MLTTTVEQVLAQYLATPPSYEHYTWDAGPPILAMLLASVGSQDSLEWLNKNVEGISDYWIQTKPPNNNLLGLYGGYTALAFGLMMAAKCSLVLGTFYAQIKVAIIEKINDYKWPDKAFDWPDYDLISGPSGILLALTQDQDIPVKDIKILAMHLSRLLKSPDLLAFRISGCEHDPERHWNFNAINLGLAHGIVGPMAALTHFIRRYQHYVDFDSALRNEVDSSLKIACQWLARQLFVDRLGITTCAPKAGVIPNSLYASRREAWCYGAPGISWVLWDVGNVLSDRALSQKGLEIFLSYLRAFNPDFHLDDDPLEKFAICHGAAGTMLVADAFAHHAHCKHSEKYARRIENLLLKNLTSIKQMANDNTSLLSGGIGILAALLVRAGGGRSWLPALALR